MSEGVAQLRFRRVATFALGVSAVGTGLVDLPVIVQQAPFVAAWWAVPALALYVPAALAFVLLPLVAPSLMRPVTVTFAVGSLVLLATLPLATGTFGLPEEFGAPWAMRWLSTYGAAAALSLSVRRTWAYVGALVVLGFVARWLAAGSGDFVTALAEDLISMSVTVPFVLLCLALLRTGAQLDLAADATIAAAARDAASAASAIERRRVELLAHDDILYTLRAASLGLGTATVTPASLASTSLARLDELDRSDLETPEVGATTFADRLRAMTTQLAPDAVFSSVPGSVVLPATVAIALLEAAGEALRNSITHAPDARVARSVDLRFQPGAVTITIADNGPGFRPDRLPAGRLGVARSIIERVNEVPGGRASVRSAPGRGSTVELGWTE